MVEETLLLYDLTVNNDNSKIVFVQANPRIVMIQFLLLKVEDRIE